jgi:hypothetical protein
MRRLGANRKAELLRFCEAIDPDARPPRQAMLLNIHTAITSLTFAARMIHANSTTEVTF